MALNHHVSLLVDFEDGYLIFVQGAENILRHLVLKAELFGDRVINETRVCTGIIARLELITTTVTQ